MPNLLLYYKSAIYVGLLKEKCPEIRSKKNNGVRYRTNFDLFRDDLGKIRG